MKDRTPTYPGRVTMTPVAGQTNTYDMVMADAPVEAGTPLNKANLLTDATAALLELTGDPTVNDALNALASRLKVSTGSYVGTGTYGSSNPNSLSFQFVPKLVIIRGAANYDNTYQSTWIGFPPRAIEDTNSNVEKLVTTWSGQTVRWYGSNFAEQANVSGCTYNYVAIG